MEKDQTPFPAPLIPANDNGGEAAPPPSARLDDALKRIARLIGRQIAREAFEARQAANDNPALPSEPES